MLSQFLNLECGLGRVVLELKSLENIPKVGSLMRNYELYETLHLIGKQSRKTIRATSESSFAKFLAYDLKILSDTPSSQASFETNSQRKPPFEGIITPELRGKVDFCWQIAGARS
jgi:hypothetical protein